jgi:hypothetical protein
LTVTVPGTTLAIFVARKYVEKRFVWLLAGRPAGKDAVL